MSVSQEIVSVFTEAQAARLTGVSARQLRYWDRTGFFSPRLADRSRRAYGRLYSFRDLVCLRILNRLRNEAKVPLPHLRTVKDRLVHLGDDLWSQTTLLVLDKRVVFVDPETGRREEVVSGQGVLEIPLAIAAGDMEARVDALRTRGPDEIGRIERHRTVMQGQPVIAGTRIAVRSIKAFAADGYSPTEIQREYPSLTEADIAAALHYGDAA